MVTLFPGCVQEYFEFLFGFYALETEYSFMILFLTLDRAEQSLVYPTL